MQEDNKPINPSSQNMNNSNRPSFNNTVLERQSKRNSYKK
jgi:hypothetical protein